MWLDGLSQLIDSPESARAWRERRYRFSYRLGDALVGETATQHAVSGAAVYGVWLSWGLLYVGQTSEAERRLRDLAIGESHHLANTFPPETWDRVVVVAWPRLPEAEGVIDRFGVKTVGLALEHHLQTWATPLTNTARRTAEGGWRAVDPTRSTSLGARTAAEVQPLFDSVRSLWVETVDWKSSSDPLPDAVRCVRPGDLLVDST
jgi:hypothetical protein